MSYQISNVSDAVNSAGDYANNLVTSILNQRLQEQNIQKAQTENQYLAEQLKQRNLNAQLQNQKSQLGIPYVQPQLAAGINQQNAAANQGNANANASLVQAQINANKYNAGAQAARGYGINAAPVGVTGVPAPLGTVSAQQQGGAPQPLPLDSQQIQRLNSYFGNEGSQNNSAGLTAAIQASNSTQGQTPQQGMPQQGQTPGVPNQSGIPQSAIDPKQIFANQFLYGPEGTRVTELQNAPLLAQKDKDASALEAGREGANVSQQMLQTIGQMRQIASQMSPTTFAPGIRKFASPELSSNFQALEGLSGKLTSLIKNADSIPGMLTRADINLFQSGAGSPHQNFDAFNKSLNNAEATAIRSLKNYQSMVNYYNTNKGTLFGYTPVEPQVRVSNGSQSGYIPQSRLKDYKKNGYQEE